MNEIAQAPRGADARIQMVPYIRDSRNPPRGSMGKPEAGLWYMIVQDGALKKGT